MDRLDEYCRELAPYFLVANLIIAACVSGPTFSAEEKNPIDGESRTTYVADEDWIPVEFQPCRTIKGSALDFSSHLDAPAGKYGAVVNRNGRFGFEKFPEKSIRFFGTNLTHQAPYLSKEDADRLVDELAAIGFNAVRIHMSEPWLTVENGSTEFRPEQKDKLDYLLNALKQKGIYHLLTIYSGASFPPGAVKDVPEYRDRKFRFEIKGLATVSEDAMNYMRRYAEAFLCSKNGHTGLALKDDPALIGVELTNENPLNLFHRHYPPFAAIFRRECAKILEGKNGTRPSEREIDAYFNRCLLDLQRRFYRSMNDYLKNELGVDRLISDVNCRSSLGFSFVRKDMDYVDVHAYWDMYRYVGAEFSGGMHVSVPRDSAYVLACRDPLSGRWNNILDAAVPRVFGKPFSCGEFNICYPAPDRSMAVPLQSSLAALQDWGMILHYAFASNPKMFLQPCAERRLLIGTSPLFLLSDRIGSRLFAQGDMTSSTVAIPLIVTPEYLYEKAEKHDTIRAPSSYSRLGWICRTGTLLVENESDLSEFLRRENPPCVVVPPDMKNIPECVRKIKYYPADKQLMTNLADLFPGQTPDCMRSTTGETVLDAEKGVFTVSTPKSECILLNQEAPSGRSRLLEIRESEVASTTFLASRDDRPLDESKQMLLLHLTDLKNTGTVVGVQEKTGPPVTYDQGRLPHLVRQDTVRISIKREDADLPRIWALRYDGKRADRIQAEKERDGFSFEVKAVSSADVYWAFELAWN